MPPEMKTLTYHHAAFQPTKAFRFSQNALHEGKVNEEIAFT